MDLQLVYQMAAAFVVGTLLIVCVSCYWCASKPAVPKGGRTGRMPQRMQPRPHPHQGTIHVQGHAMETTNVIHSREQHHSRV